jgi:hypothetical protein
MSEVQFTPGQRVWCRDGRKAEFVANSPHGTIVRLGFYRPGYDKEMDEYYDGLEVVGEVFAEAPIEVIEARVSELQAKAVALQERIYNAEKTLRESERTTKGRLERLAKFDALASIEAIIDGKMTHFVRVGPYDGVVRVLTKEQELHPQDDRCRFDPKEIRLMCLFGRSGGDLTWKVNDYYDGSGNWHAVYPCTSLDEANALATKIITKKFTTFDSARAWESEMAAKSATTIGVPIPKHIAAGIAAYKKQQIAERLSKLQAECEVLRAEIAAE